MFKIGSKIDFSRFSFRLEKSIVAHLGAKIFFFLAPKFKLDVCEFGLDNIETFFRKMRQDKNKWGGLIYKDKS